MNRVKVGVFSLSGSSATGNDAPYLRWHALDHLPEQYQIPGVLWGQRWVSTPACRAARAAEQGRFREVEHVVQYLFGEPVHQALEDFAELGPRLAELGRFPERLPSVLVGPFHFLEGFASHAALVSAEVAPFRPNRGMYLIVERPADPARADPTELHWKREQIAPLLELPGVAGLWLFAASPYYAHRRWDVGQHRVAIAYLDDEPAKVAAALRPVVARRWAATPVEPVLAAPFETLLPWQWERHARPSDAPVR
jgi:hypothetical protein